MTEQPSEPPQPPLDQAVRTRRERRVRGEREARHSIGGDLAMVGAIGWTVVAPALLGAFAGRWLDRKLHAGIFWTLGLLVAGLTLGCALAWQKLDRQ